MDVDDVGSLEDVIVAWAEVRDAFIERRPPAVDYWFLRVNGAPDGGTISVSLRASQHGPIEVAPANDMGWFERYGCTHAGLREILDLAHADVLRWSGDPWRDMP
ncbi:MAG: hypothetical protein J0L92_15175 [Deltaproteobacteria bacterium]|nr:hypothetical protein [Deltaproteobacteria bacterium]